MCDILIDFVNMYDTFTSGFEVLIFDFINLSKRSVKTVVWTSLIVLSDKDPGKMWIIIDLIINILVD